MEREAEQQRETEVGDFLRTNRLRAGLTLSEAANDANYRPNELSRVPKKYRDKPIAWQRGWLRGWDKVGAGRRF